MRKEKDMLGAMGESVVRLTALSAVSGAIDLLLKEGSLRKGVRLMGGLSAVLEIANLIFKIVAWGNC